MNTEINSFIPPNEDNETDQKLVEIIKVNDDLSLTERNNIQSHDQRNENNMSCDGRVVVDNKTYNSFN